MVVPSTVGITSIPLLTLLGTGKMTRCVKADAFRSRRNSSPLRGMMSYSSAPKMRLISSAYSPAALTTQPAWIVLPDSSVI